MQLSPMHMFARLVAKISIDVEFLVSDPSSTLIMTKIMLDLHQCCMLNAETTMGLCCRTPYCLCWCQLGVEEFR